MVTAIIALARQGLFPEAQALPMTGRVRSRARPRHAGRHHGHIRERFEYLPEIQAWTWAC